VFVQETLQEFIIGPLPNIVNLCLHPESGQNPNTVMQTTFT
jgi:hypothetical protein